MAKQELLNAETYLQHRNKINDMMDENFHLSSDGRFVFCDIDYVPPAGTAANGSSASPFNDLNVAVQAANTTGNGGVIFLSPGDYPYDAGTIDMPPNVSLINVGGTTQVNCETSFISNDTISTFEKITFALAFQLDFGDDADSVEFLVFARCSIFSTLCNFIGGSTGTDSFIFTDVIFGRDADIARTKNHIGMNHIFDACYFAAGTQTFIGSSVPTSAPRHAAKFTNCIFNRIGGNGRLTLRAEPGKTTAVTLYSCDFISDHAILFDIAATGTVELTMDLASYESILAAGADLDIVGLSIVVYGRSRYQYSDVIIPAGGVIPIAPNDPPLEAEYTDVCALSVDVIDGEVYTVSVNFVKFLGSDLNDGVYWKFTGDHPSDVFFHEAKDSEERFPFSYSFPITVSGTTFTLTLQAATENGANTQAVITDANITIERKF